MFTCKCAGCSQVKQVKHYFVGRDYLPLCDSCQDNWFGYNRQNPEWSKLSDEVLELHNKTARVRRDMMVLEFKSAEGWLESMRGEGERLCEAT